MLKIGIVEDDLLIAESITVALTQIGYSTTAIARSYNEALKMIQQEQPDLLLLDIVIDGEKDGIDLAETINKDYCVPFIFLTANSDAKTISRAKQVNPYAYLVKPFNEQDLFTSIEIAISNFNAEQKAEPLNAESVAYLKDVIFIKEGELYHKVEINDILYIESDNIYLNIFTEKRSFLIRSKLYDFVKSLNNASFTRIHRSFAINLKHLESVNSNSVKLKGKDIPLQKNYKLELLRLGNIVR